ncbi:MAG: hypothetical protein R2684_17465 [Pyrinomonadaceae bacterium]
MAQNDSTLLSIKPVGAGDLIDRAVRFYRGNFWTMVMIAAPPVIVGSIFMLAWMSISRALFNVNASNPEEMVFYQLFVGLGNLVIWVIQLVAVMIVMGGAARNFVRHLLFGDPVSFKSTYSNVKTRFFGLVAVSTILTFFLGFVYLVLFYIWMIIFALGVAGLAVALASYPSVVAVVSVLWGLASGFAALWLYFLLVSRFAYVPQVMLVEGRGAIEAIGRSMSLAEKNVFRVGSLAIFGVTAIYIALMLLYVPLGFYAWAEGVNLVSFDFADTLPAWYEIALKLVTQLSVILIMPVVVIGLCIMYVDERVRREGYDIELLAASRLGDIPDVPDQFVNPLEPAISKSHSEVSKTTDGLAGLNLS